MCPALLLIVCIHYTPYARLRLHSVQPPILESALIEQPFAPGVHHRMLLLAPGSRHRLKQQPPVVEAALDGRSRGIYTECALTGHSGKEGLELARASIVHAQLLLPEMNYKTKAQCVKACNECRSAHAL